MPVGTIVLIVISILIYLGFAQRILDRMRLSDRGALLFIAAMLVGSYLPDIPLTADLSINIGSGVVPIVLVVYLFWKADTTTEKIRAGVALLVTALAVYAVLKIFPVEPTYAILLDPLYLVAIIAGIIGYLSGRSRRTAFIAGVGAIVLNDIFTRLELFITGGRSTLVIGGAGIFDATVIAGLIAVGLAELFGEIRENLAAGNHRGQDENNNNYQRGPHEDE